VNVKWLVCGEVILFLFKQIMFMFYYQKKNFFLSTISIGDEKNEFPSIGIHYYFHSDESNPTP